MKTKWWAIGLVVLTTVLTSAGQVLYKFGTNKVALLEMPAILDYILNTFIISGLLVYGIGAVMLILALKHGELSVLYPIIATSYIWVSLLSVYFFQEGMNPYKWLGVGAVVIGVSLIGYGGTKHTPEAVESNKQVI